MIELRVVENVSLRFYVIHQLIVRLASITLMFFLLYTFGRNVVFVFFVFYKLKSKLTKQNSYNNIKKKKQIRITPYL